jgi:hypothetical protein
VNHLLRTAEKQAEDEIKRDNRGAEQMIHEPLALRT